MPTKIPFCDETINFMSGCSGPTGTPDKPRPCSYCYGVRMAKRLSAMPQSAQKYRNGFRPTFHSHEIGSFYERVRRWRKTKRVFVNSMSDTMDPGFSDAQIRQVIQVAVDWPRHTFLFLSKRPERYVRFEWPENAWLGATANDFKTMAHAGHLDLVPASVRFLSIEPITEPVHVWAGSRIDWMILGAMTGPRAVAPKHKWIRDLTDQADRQGWAVFHKPNLEKHFGSDFTRREFPSGP